MATGSDNRIARIVVAGGGLVGWSAAIALKRRLSALEVTLVDQAPPAEAVADRIGATLPSINGFHLDIGLTEADTVIRAGSSFRLGTLFEGWSAGRPPYFHAYGDHGEPFGTTSFHQHWVRAAKEGSAEAFDRHSAAAAMARADRFVHPQEAADSPLSRFEYGLFIDPARYLQLLRAYGRHVGVVVRPGSVAGVNLRSGDGFIESVRLADGDALEGDLFLDCSGPAALLRSALDDHFEAWSHWLPCDRLLAGDGPPPAELPAADRAIAFAAGWQWRTASPTRSSHGIVYASAHAGDDEAHRLLGESGVLAAGAAVPIRAGRRPEPWLRNCVVLGDASVAIEPLEWTNLHLAHSAIDRIVEMMPGRDCAPVELAEFNRQATMESDRVRDFLILHYRTANRTGEPFWRDVAAVPPPPSLAHTLSLFEERGRLPYYEEETFSRDSWLAVLLGQGVLPGRLDPLIDAVDPAAADARMARTRGQIAALISSLPSHSAYLHNLAMRARTRR
jgi:tryptophan 7-halogenase